MRTLLIRNYIAGFVVAGATIMAGLIAYETTQVPDWYIAVIAAVCGYLFAKKEAVEANLVRARGVADTVGSWVAKPAAKWIALACLALILGAGVKFVNSQMGKTYDLGYGVNITINENMTGWTTAKISNLVEWATGYVETL